MIYKSNQGLSTFDTISIIMSVVAVCLITIPIIKRRVDSQYAEAAKHQAKEWSQKITSIERLSESGNNSTSSRAPASIQAKSSGTIGADPWGQAYHYQYAKNTHGQPMYIIVWSYGPNAKNETEESKIRVSPEGILYVSFEGDDVGYVRAVR